ncbi:Crp/Fnr family transcriptional regulator [Rhizobium laguerreae]|jgi:CRP-like cAMP-binding protein|uniref:CRP-like cAMP-binding protein n=1 Tax=Rhizobium laguerreae TaxID=1076926 RepID=A0AAX2QVE3_9HYPH|nr:Crp/Fnr family transcriptional regulator [Rhizobium laguerreae]TCU30366.1 CRP-like cAMP-binding protein [Rhizobium laguerreae]
MIEIMSDTLMDYIRGLSTRRKTFGAGQDLFNQGDDVESLYLVEVGVVHLVRHQANGNIAVLQRASSGVILAEASVFSSVYHCDAVAVADVSATSVPVQLIRRALRSNSDFAEGWASYLSNQLQQTRKRAEIASLKTVAARLESWLAWNDGGLPSKGEWKALADDIGVSPEGLYRELSKRRISFVRNGT